MLQRVELGVEAPNQTRFSVRFSNWESDGLVIAPNKLKTDAENFRRAAGLLRAADNKDGRQMAGALEAMAEHWESLAL